MTQQTVEHHINTMNHLLQEKFSQLMIELKNFELTKRDNDEMHVELANHNKNENDEDIYKFKFPKNDIYNEEKSTITKRTRSNGVHCMLTLSGFIYLLKEEANRKHK